MLQYYPFPRIQAGGINKNAFPKQMIFQYLICVSFN